MRSRWQVRYDFLEQLKEEKEPSHSTPTEIAAWRDRRTRAVRELSTRYPAARSLVLPTELGNVIRAFETHPRLRYELDGIAAWPRIASMLSESERAELDDAVTDVAFWLNGLAVLSIGGALLFAERLWHRPGGFIATLAIEVAVFVSTGLLSSWAYRQTISAAVRWGDAVRAGFDVHRLDLYTTLGMYRPSTQAEEKRIAKAAGV